MINKTYLLQSGFLTYDVDGLDIGVEKIQTINNAILSPTVKVVKQDMYSPEINRLLLMYMNDSNIISNFQFREDYLKEVIRLFNGMSAYNWFYLQSNSPYLSNISVEFMIDMFKYIIKGERSLDPVSWFSLVGRSNVVKYNDSLKDIVDCYFGMYKNTRIHTGTTLCADISSFISQWTSRPEGMKDFILTMGAIFANHYQISMR